MRQAIGDGRVRQSLNPPELTGRIEVHKVDFTSWRDQEINRGIPEPRVCHQQSDRCLRVRIQWELLDTVPPDTLAAELETWERVAAAIEAEEPVPVVDEWTPANTPQEGHGGRASSVTSANRDSVNTCRVRIAFREPPASRTLGAGRVPVLVGAARVDRAGP